MKILIVLLLAVTISCNGGGGGGGGSSSAAQVSHLGLWYHCENYDGDSSPGNDSSLERVLTIGDSTMSLVRTNFDTTDCSSGHEDYNYQDGYSYHRSGNTYSIVLETEHYTPLSAADVTWDNANAWCELTNWALNVPQSILSKNCDGETSHQGDTGSFVAVRSGTSLSIGVLNYTLAGTMDVSPAGQTIPNGTYGFSDGTNLAIYITFNNGAYTAYTYDLRSHLYETETGTYTSANNVATFTITSTTPGGCSSGSLSRRFAYGSQSVSVEFTEIDEVIMAVKMGVSEINFRNGYLGGGFSAACL